MVRAGIVGASGYAGAELVRLLAGHPEVELTALTCRQDAGEPFDRIYPALTGWVDLVCDAYDAGRLADQTDVVFTALPHQLPMTLVPDLLARGLKVIDLSADFRFQDAAVYEAHYQPHTAAELLQRAVYGLSEVFAEQIRNADLIGNPGCYPTSVLLPLVPLIEADLIDTDLLIADAKSGVSGAGRGASLGTHYCSVNESFKAYKVAGHRHTPEMEAIMSRVAGRPVQLNFVPHLVPMTRGMETTIYTRPREGVTLERIAACLADSYRGKSFIRLRGAQPPDTLHVRGTNCCDIGYHLDGRTGRLVLMSAIDNLVKGAAGQAVQNMNIMLGLPETEGLQALPCPL
ncbi:N-acetyl-gamma-glutamyl-phosphate reductase [Desulfatitalea alkaliphila]|uniref:N-acetyl-gamma-glutamyl-phosphate reductase n=1 Tax=Desulfatitalea alkaliphila TaxID=2929485 RepID=A0AA41R3F6_9BACT|nr:N-acetyl-gamma-glutamyl-phosphate reductase [Desulfatitalea alkaliphila]MCJ8500066.1 N-acetyl-gamma-glutamyl-phosphate reductase [Desulfatitalea alkaliphila]